MTSSSPASSRPLRTSSSQRDHSASPARGGPSSATSSARRDPRDGVEPHLSRAYASRNSRKASALPPPSGCVRRARARKARRTSSSEAPTPTPRTASAACRDRAHETTRPRALRPAGGRKRLLAVRGPSAGLCLAVQHPLSAANQQANCRRRSTPGEIARQTPQPTSAPITAPAARKGSERLLPGGPSARLAGPEPLPSRDPDEAASRATVLASCATVPASSGQRPRPAGT
mmetsp:Transcript_7148/g.21824  ORF Transcript_7148/g.21824 Transcript_7148/m.21824 type:complete len:231 (-) Transcript_7148:213-905(-)